MPGLADHLEPIHVEQIDGVATISLLFAGANRFDLTRVRLLTEKIQKISRDSHVRVIVIRSDNPAGFSTGFSFSVFHESQTEDDRLALSAAGQKLTAIIQDAPCITVVELTGPCLGPAFELALAFDYRIAVATPKMIVGFPDSKVGLFPSWGGMSLLVRKIGSKNTERLLSNGYTFTAREAVKCGLINIACCERRAKIECRQLIDHIISKPRKASVPGFFTRRRIQKSIQRIIPATKSNFDKPLQSLLKAAQLSANESKAAERACFAKAAASGPVIASYQLAKMSELPPKLKSENIYPIPTLPHVVGIISEEKVVSIARIAACMAVHGIRIITSQSMIELIHTAIQNAGKRGELTPLETDQANRRIHQSEDYDRAGLVICDSASTVDIGQIEKIVPPRCVIAIANSAIEFKQHEAIRPARIAGLHLPNEKINQSFIEVAVGEETSDDTTASIMNWLQEIGYTAIFNSDEAVLPIRRVLNAYWDEAVRLVAEGIPVHSLDEVVRANGTTKGPLEQLDELGFDQTIDGVRRLLPLIAAGMNGRGTGNGHGFYRYKRGKRDREYTAACSILWDARAINQDGPIDPLASLDLLPPARALVVAGSRLTMRIVNESIHCLFDQSISDPGSIDLAIAKGADLLPFAGGPLRFAERRGLLWVATKLAELTNRYGERFKPHPELIRRTMSGQNIYLESPKEVLLELRYLKAA